MSQLKAGKVRGKFCLSGGQTVVGDVRYDGEAAAATILHMEASFSQTPTHTLFMYLHNTTIWSSVRDFDGARRAIRLAQNAAAKQPLAIDVKDDKASGQVGSGSAACGAYAIAPSGDSAIKTPTQSSLARSSTTAFLLAAVALTLLLAVGAPAMQLVQGTSVQGTRPCQCLLACCSLSAGHLALDFWRTSSRQSESLGCRMLQHLIT
jgi:hypothetical protein